jgi:hypothetical protein
MLDLPTAFIPRRSWAVDQSQPVRREIAHRMAELLRNPSVHQRRTFSDQTRRRADQAPREQPRCHAQHRRPGWSSQRGALGPRRRVSSTDTDRNSASCFAVRCITPDTGRRIKASPMRTPCARRVAHVRREWKIVPVIHDAERFSIICHIGPSRRFSRPVDVQFRRTQFHANEI